MSYSFFTSLHLHSFPTFTSTSLTLHQMTPIQSHMAHPSALPIDSGPHFSPLFSPCYFFTSVFSNAASIYRHFLDLRLILLLNTSSSYLGILTLCLAASMLSQFSLYCFHLLSLCLLLSHSFKSTPSVTLISNYHSHSAPDSSLVAPILPHNTPI